MPKTRRKNVLPMPSLQMHLIVICLFIAGCSAMLQAILVQRFVTNVLLALPAGETVSRHQAAVWMLEQFFICLGIMIPIVVGLGILATFRYAGPLLRFHRHLARIAAGEDPGPCRLRKGDQLQALAELINRAVDTLRAGAAANSGTAIASSALPATTDETVEHTAS